MNNKEHPMYEYLSEKLFNNLLIDIIMERDKITENQAIEFLNNLNIADEDYILEGNTGASIRKGIIETLKKLDYDISCLIGDRTGYLQPLKG